MIKEIIPHLDYDSSSFTIKTVQERFYDRIVVDPSFFWDKERIKLLITISRKFNTKFIIPARLYAYIREKKKYEFVQLITNFWKGDYENVSAAFDFLVYHRRRSGIKLRVRTRVRRNNSLFDLLQSKFGADYDILYDLIDDAYQSNTFIVGFGRSPPMWLTKLQGACSDKIKLIIKNMDDKITELHTWKNYHIKPQVAKHPEFFSALGGTIAWIISFVNNEPMLGDAIRKNSDFIAVAIAN